MKSVITCIATALLIGGAGIGCQSRYDSDVKSNLRTQSIQVSSDVKATTNAAKSVLEETDLKDVNSNATNVDGLTTGTMADGTKVTVTVQKVTDETSQAMVNVGRLGDPSLGAELAKKIKMKAEGK
ncbi:MAG TPA: DUF3568 family protein [Tepidisphaeraceae bacterium]